MSAPEKNTLAAELRQYDSPVWNKIFQEVLPKVVHALCRRFNTERKAESIEDAATSAVRSLVASAHEQWNLTLETMQDVENWLVVVAGRKCLDMRKKHRPELKASLEALKDCTDEEWDQAIRETTEAMYESLSPIEQAVFSGKLAEKSNEEIAADSRTPTEIKLLWRSILRRLRAHFQDPRLSPRSL